MSYSNEETFFYVKFQRIENAINAQNPQSNDKLGNSEFC